MSPPSRALRLIPLILAFFVTAAGATTKLSDTESGEVTLPGFRPVQIENPVLQQSLTSNAEKMRGVTF